MSINYQDDWASREKFSSELIDGETISWAGQPDPSVIFSKSDAIMIPFSLLWGGFAIFWELSALAPCKPGSGSGGTDFIFPLFGVPFVLIGIYMIIGRFFYKAWKKKRTYYAVTDQRILILTKTGSTNLQALFFKDIPAIQKSVCKNGIGSIIFSNQDSVAATISNQWVTSNNQNISVPSFEDIHDADSVYDLINRLRTPQDKKVY